MQPVRYVNRAEKKGANLFCDRACAGLFRRVQRPPEEKKALKAAYDARRREDLRDRLRAEKAAYHKRTYDPAKARNLRKATMPRHVEYCRRPAYRKWKADYDRKHRATKQFGPFAEAAILLGDLESEILSRATRYEIDLANGTLNKKLQRRRDYERQTDRR
jgi:hypothetical protein